MKRILLILAIKCVVINSGFAQDQQIIATKAADAIERLNVLSTSGTIVANILIETPLLSDEELRQQYTDAENRGTSITVLDKSLVKGKLSSGTDCLRYNFEFYGYVRNLATGIQDEIRLPSEDTVLTNNEFVHSVHQQNEMVVSVGNTSNVQMGLYKQPLGYFSDLLGRPSLASNLRALRHPFIWTEQLVDGIRVISCEYSEGDTKCRLYAFKLDSSDRLVQAELYKLGKCDQPEDTRILQKVFITYGADSSFPNRLVTESYGRPGSNNEVLPGVDIRETMDIVSYSERPDYNFIGTYSEALLSIATEKVLVLGSNSVVNTTDLITSGTKR